MPYLPDFALPLVRVSAILASTFLFSQGLPRREGFPRRSAVVCFAFAVVVFLVDWVGFGLLDWLTRDHPFAWGLATLSVVLASLVAAVMACWEASVWNALFCATAGYTLENIAEGLAFLVELPFSRLAGAQLDPLGQALLLAMAALLTLGLLYGTFVRPVRATGVNAVDDRSMIAVFVLVVMAVIMFDQLIRATDRGGTAVEVLVGLRLVHGAMCAFILFAEYRILYAHQAEVEVQATRRLVQSREAQYELSRQNIEAINLKCHDIRHQIRGLANGVATVDQAILDDIAREVSVYDSQVRTGNAALDTILTEKGILFQAQGITFTCVADGAALGFMAPADLYALFGNALDNAARAVCELDEEKRSIFLVIRKAMGMASIHLENRFAGETEFRDGMPVTSTGDETNHGFGTKSMRLICERYGGSVTFKAADGVFHVNAAIPLP